MTNIPIKTNNIVWELEEYTFFIILVYCIITVFGKIATMLHHYTFDSM